MPLCFPSKSTAGMSADPQIRDVEKRIAAEEHTDQRNLDHVMKDLKTSEKTYQKAIKVSYPACARSSLHALTRVPFQSADKAQHNVDNAVKKEHKAAAALEKAGHNHKASIAAEESAEKSLIVRVADHLFL